MNGPIYWSAAGGAHPVVNHFLAAWARHGYEGGYIGYPTTDEIVNADGVGRRQEFTGAAIYWRLNEAYSIGGAIRDKWAAMGGESGALGYPITDELPGVRHGGRYNDFTNGTTAWKPMYERDIAYSLIRCDQALTAGQIGCIFPAEIPLLPYYDPYRLGQLAGHIAAAQASGIPGDYEADLPLHKGTREAETENRDNACKTNPRVPSVRSDRDCDEYPFASAREGAASGGTERTFQGCGLPLVAQNLPNGSPITGPRYSICLINPSHNRSGGGDARWFYHHNRVLMDDPFYVDVMSGSLPTGSP
ncbi:hypothetical protein M2405_004282 [Rhodococcus erythropolis]|nr:hypothetical protein [Rhodococcus erythropolis]MCW2425496.1 hypothetical protein [Rhodococcus erythropolis]